MIIAIIRQGMAAGASISIALSRAKPSGARWASRHFPALNFVDRAYYRIRVTQRIRYNGAEQGQVKGGYVSDLTKL